MAIEKVKAYFREHGMEERIQEFDESSATVIFASPAATISTASFSTIKESVFAIL